MNYTESRLFPISFYVLLTGIKGISFPSCLLKTLGNMYSYYTRASNVFYFAVWTLAAMAIFCAITYVVSTHLWRDRLYADL